MVDLRWYLACEVYGWVPDDVRATGWPAVMELEMLANLQFPPVSRQVVLDEASPFDQEKREPRTGVYDPARNQRAALYEAMVASYKAGQLPLVRRPSDWDPQMQCWGLRPESFALWFHAQGGTPSVHILAWFESQQVDFPPKNAAAHQAMTGFAALLASRKAKRKGQEWTDEEKQQLRAEFQRRGGWMPDGPGCTPRKSQKVRQELARELGMRADRGLDRHLGEAPEPSTAFSGFMRVLADRR